LQESLSVAHRSGAIQTKDLERVVVDTTVQEKAIAHPTDARLTHRAIEKLTPAAYATNPTATCVARLRDVMMSVKPPTRLS
jgi:hypothetical protein